MMKAMKRRQRSRSMAFAVGAVLLLALAGCGSGDAGETSADNTETTDEQVEETQESPDSVRLTEAPAETDFFEVTIDGEPFDGSGLVFRNGDELSLRGLFGAEMDHLQLDLTSSGFGEQTPTIFGPVLSRVIGLDASANAYELVEDASNRLSINERGPALTVWGDFSFLAKDASSGEQVTISGIFDIPIGNGNGDWDCDWGGQPPACGFIS